MARVKCALSHKISEKPTLLTKLEISENGAVAGFLIKKIKNILSYEAHLQAFFKLSDIIMVFVFKT
jgi:hypothetical protein